MTIIKLGDKVKDIVTGYEGIATSRTEFLNGCIQFEVTAKVPKGKVTSPESLFGIGIDAGQIKRIGPGLNAKTPIKKKNTGGPMRIVPRRAY